MKSIPLLVVIAFMFFATQRASAQTVNDSLKLIPGHTYLITKTDNAQLKGVVLNQSETETMVNIPNKGIVLIQKADIKHALDETPVEVPRIRIEQERGRLAYWEIGAGGGGSFYLGTDLTYISKNHTLLSVGYLFLTKRDPKSPSEDRKSFFSHYPYIGFNALSLNCGKIFLLPNSSARWIIKGGIFIGSCSMPTDYEYTKYIVLGWSSSTERYGYVYRTESMVAGGILFQPGIQFPTGPHFGINISGYLDVNTATTPSVGLTANMMFGKVMAVKSRG